MSDDEITLQNIIMKSKKPEKYKLQEEIINKKIKLCIGKIVFGNTFGSCCFIFIKEKNLKIILTSNHVITKESLKSKDKINIYVEDTKKEINLKKKRFIYSNKYLDFTVIQILESDFIDNFLEVDDYIFVYNYEKEFIYCLQYPFGELNNDTGKIIEIKKGIIKHSISTSKGSSGSPLILANHRIIGIHKGASKKNYNVGIFMKEIIIEINRNDIFIIKENFCDIFFYKLIKYIEKSKRTIYNILYYLLIIFLIHYFLFRKRRKILKYENGIIKYYGYMKDDKMEGEGTSYYENGEKKYVGNWKNGKRDGEGISYYPDGKIEYIGTFAYDLFNGNGIYYYYAGHSNISYDFIYTGSFYNNHFNEFGNLYFKEINLRYEGFFTYGFIKFYGKIYLNGNIVYNGTTVLDLFVPFNGYTLSFDNGIIEEIHFDKYNLDGYCLVFVEK